jgi:hypothetical protein
MTNLLNSTYRTYRHSLLVSLEADQTSITSKTEHLPVLRNIDVDSQQARVNGDVCMWEAGKRDTSLYPYHCVMSPQLHWRRIPTPGHGHSHCMTD